MTFVTPLLYGDVAVSTEKRLQELVEDGTIRQFVTCEFNSSFWFTGMYKDSWPAPPTIEIMDEVINKLAWCADEGSYGGWVDNTK